MISVPRILISWSLILYGLIRASEAILIACNEDDSNCKCEKQTLDCSKKYINDGPLRSPIVWVRNFEFVNATFYDNEITSLRKNRILPALGRNKIIKLSFTMNKISTIEPGSFDEFPSLKYLSLAGNPLKTIDSDVLTPKLGSTLEDLYLDDTQLESLPLTAFKYLIALRELDLRDNPKIAKNFTKELFGPALQNLIGLNLINTSISKLEDDAFIHLKSLDHIFLANNFLTSIPRAFQSLSNLLHLNLMANPIKHLDRSTFIGMNPKLESLTIPHGNLTTIGDCAFCLFNNLNFVSLEFNPDLISISENAFNPEVRSKGVEYFMISDSQISILPEKLMNWDGVKHLQIGANPYTCDCSMAWLIDDLKSNNSKYFKNLQWKWMPRKMPRCAQPYSLMNVSFSEVPDNFCNRTRTLEAAADVPEIESGMFGNIVLVFSTVIALLAILGYIFRAHLFNLYIDIRYKTLRSDETTLRWSYDPENDDF